jgi:hypothetical protein
LDFACDEKVVVFFYAAAPKEAKEAIEQTIVMAH